jgi:hypothetical protein
MSVVQGMLSIIMKQAESLFGIGLLICLIPLVWFIIGILLCIWVYRDAENRGMNGVLWLIVVLIAGIIGLIIYLVVRKDKTTSERTPPPQS